MRDVDAVVLATPGTTHEKQLLACLEHGKPVMCEKPLTTDVATSLEVVKREAELGKRLIQVGFMRRFDAEYVALKALLGDGELGTPLVMHCVHRNAEVPPNFDSSMIVKDSLVHEVDVTRFLFDEEITSIQVIKPAANPNAPQGLQDPQIAIFQTASGKHVDVEVFVTTGVAYEVRTEVVGERGSAMIGLDVGLVRKSAPGHWGGQITPSFKERFGLAYDVEIQRWVDAVRSGVERSRRPVAPGTATPPRGLRGRRRSPWSPDCPSRWTWSRATRSREPDRGHRWVSGTMSLFRLDLESPGPDDLAIAAVHHVLSIDWVEPADITRAVLFLASEEPAR